MYKPMREGTYWQSSRYGMRYNKNKKKYELHGGVDFAAPSGIPVYSAEAGIVESISLSYTGFGKSIVIDHGNGVKTRYAHLSKILVKKKQHVKALCKIALVGATGNTRSSNNKKGDASHLHFELLISGKRYNPMLHFK